MQPLSLMALYEGYVTAYRARARRLQLPATRLQHVEQHHAKLARFLQQVGVVGIAAQAFSPEHAQALLTWLTSTQHYSRARAVRQVLRVQRVLWWGVEREYVLCNPLADFCPNGVESLGSQDLEQAPVQQIDEMGKPPPESRLDPEQIQQLGKLRIVFGFVKLSLGRRYYQALCEQVGVESVAPEQAGRLRVTLEVFGRDQYRFYTPILVTRQSWDFQKQRASGPGSELINQQVAAFISLLYKLFIDLIERRQPLTAGALVRAYRNESKSL